MKKTTVLLAIIAFFFAGDALLAQLKFENNGYSAALSGFIRTDMFYDTHENLESREGTFAIIPLPKEIQDAHEETRSKYNMAAIQTRLGVRLDAPDFNDMIIGGYIEYEYFGTTDANINTPRLRHAYIDITTGKSNFKIGQYWHVLNDHYITPTCQNPTIGLAYAAGIRAPQFRYTYNATDECSIYAMLSAQRDFASPGPQGVSTIYARRAIPEFGMGVKYRTKDFGVSLNASMKSLKPHIYAGQNTPSPMLHTYATTAHLRYSTGNFIVKVMGGYGQNLADALNISGYGGIMTAPETVELTAMNQLVSFIDMSYGKKLQFGVFAGFNKNLGTDGAFNEYFSRYARVKKNADGTIAGITDIESTFRVVPRLVHRLGNFSYGVEFDMSVANWGLLKKDTKGEFDNPTAATNYRGSLAFTYHL